MTPERVREAATKVQLLAGQADSSPWIETPKASRYGGLVSGTAPADEDMVEGYGGALIAESLMQRNRAYIAALHPQVGLALGAFLDDLADLHDESAVNVDTWPSLTGLIDALLGSETSS